MQESPAQHHLQPADAFAHFIATGFYSGKSPVMPGTAGTLVAVAVFALLQSVFPQLQQLGWECAIAIGSTGLGLIVTRRTLESGVFGAALDDPQQIVVDEIAGYAVTLLGCPFGLEGCLVGFFLFRLFDMTKPPPIRRIERLPGAAGIVFDDILAGIFAALVASLYFAL